MSSFIVDFSEIGVKGEKKRKELCFLIRAAMSIWRLNNRFIPGNEYLPTPPPPSSERSVGKFPRMYQSYLQLNRPRLARNMRPALYLSRFCVVHFIHYFLIYRTAFFFLLVSFDITDLVLRKQKRNSCTGKFKLKVILFYFFFFAEGFQQLCYFSTV